MWQRGEPSTTAETSGTSAWKTTAEPTESTTSVVAAVDTVDFRSWRQFGGIVAQISGDGRSVVLDTGDTDGRMTRPWSGLIAPGAQRCTTRISGQARDINHAAAVTGGFGVGLMTVKTDTSNQEIAYGSAFQYDFGLQSYFAVSYPEALNYGLVAAPLDHEWHTFTVTIDAQGWITAEIDGTPAVRGKGAAVCGTPGIRVWAGAAEFRDFTVEP